MTYMLIWARNGNPFILNAEEANLQRYFTFL